MNECNTLPGFDNIDALQLDENRLCLALNTGNEQDTVPTVIIDRRDYDSDPEFVQECRQWARKHGGKEITPERLRALDSLTGRS